MASERWQVGSGVKVGRTRGNTPVFFSQGVRKRLERQELSFRSFERVRKSAKEERGKWKEWGHLPRTICMDIKKKELRERQFVRISKQNPAWQKQRRYGDSEEDND